jgi:peptidoglycan/LPS O-acetylase OafA/YrhL
MASDEARLMSIVESPRIDLTRRAARVTLVLAVCAIAGGYAAAFIPGGAPAWAPWLLAIGIPAALGGIMALGAARGSAGIGKLKFPFAFVFVVLTAGFCLALGLPANEGPASTLWLGLPARAAIVIYGIGLLPIVVLPVAYALTFDTQTLSQSDIDRVRELAAQRVAASVDASGKNEP